MTYSQSDLIRLAAFIDGEGCIQIDYSKRAFKKGGKPHHSCRLAIVIGNTDPRLAAWVRSVFGGNLNVDKRTQRKSTYRHIVKWQIYGKQAVELLKVVYPYLLLKKEQAEVAMAFHSTLRGPGYKVSEEMLKSRFEMIQSLRDLKHDHYLDLSDSEATSTELLKEYLN